MMNASKASAGSLCEPAPAVAHRARLAEVVEEAIPEMTGGVRERVAALGERYRRPATPAVEADHRGDERPAVDVVADREVDRSAQAGNIDVETAGLRQR